MTEAPAAAEPLSGRRGSALSDCARRLGIWLTTCRTGELGVVGLTVCFDGDFPEVARALRLAGATLVLQPSPMKQRGTECFGTAPARHVRCMNSERKAPERGREADAVYRGQGRRPPV